MTEITSLMALVAALFVAAASPGPATLAVATVAMSAGRRAGLRFGLGLSIGLAFWGLVAATGLGAVLEASTYALFLLKIFGGLYLLWLAIRSVRSSFDPLLSPASPRKSEQGFGHGLLLNLSNPKAVFAWMAVLAVGLEDQNTASDLIGATVLCMSLGFGIYAFYAVLFSTPHAMQLYSKTRRWVDRVVAVLFAFAGFALLRSAFSKT